MVLSASLLLLCYELLFAIITTSGSLFDLTMSGVPMNIKNNENICVLVSEHDPPNKFVLVDKEPIILGRTQQTGIKDQRLSKTQMKFEADYSKARVIIEQLGCNKSAVNGQSMIKGEKRLLYHGDKVSLLFKSNYTYRLNFLSPSMVESSKKRISCTNQDTSPKKVRLNDTAKWKTIDGSLIVYNSPNLVHKNKIAAFDMDGTLIVTQSGKVFPIDFKDWKIFSPEVTKSLRQLSNDDYKIVIFTNQGGIGNKNVNEDLFKQKVENIVEVIKTPVQVFVATQNDIYRKPAPGMWNTFISDYNGGLTVDMSSSFFCGDAAGRLARIGSNGKQIKKDHSCCDRLFAMNVGLKFYTPEEYFWKARTEEYKLPTFNPKDVMKNVKYTDSSSKLFSPGREMIIMVGCPGSGKSYFASNKLGCNDHVKIINRDTLGTWQKCVNEAKRYLEDFNYSVVIDNTNPDKESRKRFIEIAQILNVPCRVFLMNVSKEHAKHNNKFRELTDKKHQKISDIIINMYYSKFEEPSLNEGIDEIVQINFVPHFNDSKHELLYKMFLL